LVELTTGLKRSESTGIALKEKIFALINSSQISIFNHFFGK